MNILDVLIILGVVVAVAAALRSLIKGTKKGCAGCASAGSCSASAEGRSCPAAHDMLARAEKALGKDGSASCGCCRGEDGRR